MEECITRSIGGNHGHRVAIDAYTDRFLMTSGTILLCSYNIGTIMDTEWQLMHNTDRFMMTSGTIL